MIEPSRIDPTILEPGVGITSLSSQDSERAPIRDPIPACESGRPYRDGTDYSKLPG